MKPWMRIYMALVIALLVGACAETGVSHRSGDQPESAVPSQHGPTD